LVKLWIPPSAASDAVNELWGKWNKDGLFDEKNTYAVILPSGDKWTAEMYWQSPAGGSLYRRGKRPEEMQLPTRAFVVIPMSSVFTEVTKKLMNALGNAEKHRTKDTRS
jgi:hypothetical protein